MILDIQDESRGHMLRQPKGELFAICDVCGGRWEIQVQAILELPGGRFLYEGDVDIDVDCPGTGIFEQDRGREIAV